MELFVKSTNILLKTKHFFGVCESESGFYFAPKRDDLDLEGEHLWQRA